jgi:hypothetical protein
MPFDISALLSKLEFLTSEHFWTGVVVATVLAFSHQIRNAAVSLAQRAWMTRSQYGLSGFWAGECMLPSFKGGPSLELWRYSLIGDRVKLAFYSYSPEGLKPVKWVGGGIFRGNTLSAYYYVKDPNTPESGTITMELTGENLVGVYAQFDPKAPHDPNDPNARKNPLFVCPREPPYEQVRVKLTRRQRAWVFFGRPPVNTFQEVARLRKAAGVR